VPIAGHSFAGGEMTAILYIHFIYVAIILAQFSSAFLAEMILGSPAFFLTLPFLRTLLGRQTKGAGDS